MAIDPAEALGLAQFWAMVADEHNMGHPGEII